MAATLSDPVVPDTPEADVIKAYKRAKKAFLDGRTKSLEWRKGQLVKIQQLLAENTEEISQALVKDLGVNKFFTHNIEVSVVNKELKLFLKNLDAWAKPKSVSTPLLLKPGESLLMPEPRGVVLIISPWNYPVSLVFMPLIAALAAGNSVVVKPSEISMHTSILVERLCTKYLDTECITFVQGGVAPTQRLLQERFDYICYTGNGRVARIVHAAAAKHLTPVLFELGGKSPCIVTQNAEIVRTCERIAWGKWTMNMGQTCITPDYIATTPDMVDKIVATLQDTITRFYTANPKTSPDVSRLVSTRHASRVASMLDDPEVKIEIGGERDVAGKYIAPTVVRASANAKCMQEELDEIIEYVNEHDKPLALYLFSTSKAEQTKVLEKTSAGGVSINDVIMHVANDRLPLCGIGESGIGSYHGKFGFDSFSHTKPVYFKKGGRDPKLRFPPYTEKKLYWFNKLSNLDEDAFYFYLKLAAGAIAAVVAGAVYMQYTKSSL